MLREKIFHNEKVVMEPLVYQQEQDSDGLHIPETRTHIQHVLHAVHGLTLLRKVLQHRAGQAVLDLLRTLALPDPEPVEVAASYSHAFCALAEAANDDATPPLGDAWQAYLAGRLLDDCNPWSEQVERVGDTR